MIINIYYIHSSIIMPTKVSELTAFAKLGITEEQPVSHLAAVGGETKEDPESSSSSSSSSSDSEVADGRAMVGIHVFKGSYRHLWKACRNALALGHPSLQIFTHGPRSRRRNAIDVKKLHEIGTTVPLYVHEPYTLKAMWSDSDRDKQRASMVAMVDVFKAAAEIAASGVVIHFPSKTATEIIAVLSTLAAALERARINVPIIMETPNYNPHPTMTFETPQKMNNFRAALVAAGLGDRVGLCVDTAHIYISMVKITRAADAKKYLDDLDTSWLQLVHLNGNEYKQGTRFGDKHAVPFSVNDQVWGANNHISYRRSGCKVFIDRARALGVPVVLELKPTFDVDPFYRLIAE